MHELALITGASSGLGKALALKLADQGISLILVARDEIQLKEIAQGLPIPPLTHLCDLTVPAQRASLIQLIHELSPDLVINNAGGGLYGPILSHPLKKFQEMLSVNAQAVMEISIESAKALKHKNKKGTIVNISSAAAFVSYPTFCVYAATKAFVNNFSQGFDEEMRPHGIQILTCCPGQINTDFRKKAACHFPQQKGRFILKEKRVVELILKQIDSGKQIQIIDWKYQLAVAIVKLLPRRFRNWILSCSLKNRYKKSI